MKLSETEKKRIDLKVNEIKTSLEAEIAKREVEQFDLKLENEYLKNEVARKKKKLTKCQF